MLFLLTVCLWEDDLGLFETPSDHLLVNVNRAITHFFMVELCGYVVIKLEQAPGSIP